MKKNLRILSKHNLLFYFIVILIFLLFFIFSKTIFFNPIGYIGDYQKKIIVLVSFLVIPIILITTFLSLKFFFRHKKNKKLYDPNFTESSKIEKFIWFSVSLIVFFISIISWKSTHLLDPRINIKKINNVVYNNQMKVEVISLDWKWLFIYPKYGIATINELVVPVNTPIEFNITSSSVMNSFFIPGVGSQMYAMSGMNSKLNLIFNNIGQYKGFSSNFSGDGFSDMKFKVIVKENCYNFKKWIKNVKNKGSFLSLEKYLKIENPSNSNVEYFSFVKKDLFNIVLTKFKKII
ncbi:MAG: COX aromatic rich motif-containing protein [Enterobacteriaceae bacterium]